MKADKRVKTEAQREPIGIVISGGPVNEAPPVFSAFVWGPAPEETRPVLEPRAG